jgi:hypothetical protein
MLTGLYRNATADSLKHKLGRLREEHIRLCMSMLAAGSAAPPERVPRLLALLRHLLENFDSRTSVSRSLGGRADDAGQEWGTSSAHSSHFSAMRAPQADRSAVLYARVEGQGALRVGANGQETLGTLRQRLAEACGRPAFHLRLFLEDREIRLPDATPLLNTKISDGALLVVRVDPRTPEQIERDEAAARRAQSGGSAAAREEDRGDLRQVLHDVLRFQLHAVGLVLPPLPGQSRHTASSSALDLPKQASSDTDVRPPRKTGRFPHARNSSQPCAGLEADGPAAPVSPCQDPLPTGAL